MKAKKKPDYWGDDDFEDDDSYEYSMGFYLSECGEKLAVCYKCLRIYDITYIPNDFKGQIRNSGADRIHSLLLDVSELDKIEGIYCCEKSEAEQRRIWARKNKKGR